MRRFTSAQSPQEIDHPTRLSNNASTCQSKSFLADREKGRGYKRPLFIIRTRVNVSLIPVLALAPSPPVPTFPYRILYLPCPTVHQMKLTKDLIDQVGKKSTPGFSVNMISPGTSVNQHCGFASPIENQGSLSIVLYVKLHNGVAPNYEQIQSLHEKIVDLSTDYYESTKHIVPSNQVWGKHFISGLNPYFQRTGEFINDYLREKIESEEVILTDGGGWQCNKNCCILPENMRTSYLGHDRGGHDRKHNTPGIWSEVPNLLGGVQRFNCSNCPGTRGRGMMDYVKAPKAKKTTVGAPYHSFKVSRIKAHVEGGKPRKKQKVHAGILAHCSKLASQDIPFVHPPPQCAFYGTPYSSSGEVKCYRTTCPLLPPNRVSHSWSICSDVD